MKIKILIFVFLLALLSSCGVNKQPVFPTPTPISTTASTATPQPEKSYHVMKEADLNGDGIVETIYFKRVYVDDDKRLSVKIDDFEYLTGINIGPLYELEGQIKIVDIDSADAYQEISVNVGESSTEYLRFSNGKISSLGIIHYDINGACYTDGSGLVSVRTTYNILHSWDYIETYVYDATLGQFRLKEQDYYEAVGPYQHTVLKNFSLQASQEDTTIVATLQPGDKIKLLGSDNKEWVLAETANGVQGWFSVITTFEEDASLYLDGLVNAG